MVIFIVHVVIFSVNMEKIQIVCHIAMVLIKYTSNMGQNNNHDHHYKRTMILRSLLIIFAKPFDQISIVLIVIQRQSDTYNNKPKYCQPMYFC